MRAIAAIAAIVLIGVSVQAGVLEACGLCPPDCPMHAESVAARQHHGQAEAKPRCHGVDHRDADGQTKFRRPPCKTSFTLAASLLPPFVLSDHLDDVVVFESSMGAGTASERLLGRDPRPDTPPPILFV
jgi:hypothetical protein